MSKRTLSSDTVLLSGDAACLEREEDAFERAAWRLEAPAELTLC